MKHIGSGSVVNILRNTLNYVDARLTGHGNRVSYMVYRMLDRIGGFSPTMLRDMSVLALLHDIGAYKTEEIDQMVRFETEEVWDHSIWGYLFMTYFSPLSNLAPALLYHHVDYSHLTEIDPLHQLLAQVINITDRADTFALEKRPREELVASFNAWRDTRYRSDIVDVFFELFPQEPMQSDIETDMGYRHIMTEIPFSPEAIEAYLQMNILSIDFRSHNTATHTITTSAISKHLAALLGYDDANVQRIGTGALLHDLGKTGIPVEILEYPGKLSAPAMRIMKRHVVMTEAILLGNIDEDMLRIAVRHHEKLDGTGYPRGLATGDLSVPERIVAVADIMSALYETRSYKDNYPKARVVGILEKMAADGLIDASIVAVAADHFDEITSQVKKTRAPILDSYHQLQQSFAALKAKYDPEDAKSQRKPRFAHDDAYNHL